MNRLTSVGPASTEKQSVTFGGAVTAPIDERDIADVAARALVDSEGRHAGRKYVLTGPEALTHADQVRIIGEAIGRPLQFLEMSREIAFQQFSKSLPRKIVNLHFGRPG